MARNPPRTADPSLSEPSASEPPVSDPSASELPSVVVHADESCLGNQFRGADRPGGAAALIETWKDGAWVRRDLWTCSSATTNNRMALVGAVMALDILKVACRVRFVSDSQYLVKGASEWMPGWKRRKWRRKGGPIGNLEMWQRLDRSVSRHQVSWQWVRGHAGDPKNEYVDHLAVRAAEEQSASPGLVSSGFEEWLNRQREERDRFWDYFEFAPPQPPGGPGRTSPGPESRTRP